MSCSGKWSVDAGASSWRADWPTIRASVNQKEADAPFSAPDQFNPKALASARRRAGGAVAGIALEEQRLAGDGGYHRGLERL